MQEIQFIAPAALHDEMLRLRNEKQMDFLESLTGMDWGVACLLNTYPSPRDSQTARMQSSGL